MIKTKKNNNNQLTTQDDDFKTKTTNTLTRTNPRDLWLSGNAHIFDILMF